MHIDKITAQDVPWLTWVLQGSVILKLKNANGKTLAKSEPFTFHLNGNTLSTTNLNLEVKRAGIYKSFVLFTAHGDYICHGDRHLTMVNRTILEDTTVHINNFNFGGVQS